MKRIIALLCVIVLLVAMPTVALTDRVKIDDFVVSDGLLNLIKDMIDQLIEAGIEPLENRYDYEVYEVSFPPSAPKEEADRIHIFVMFTQLTGIGISITIENEKLNDISLDISEGTNLDEREIHRIFLEGLGLSADSAEYLESLLYSKRKKNLLHDTHIMSSVDVDDDGKADFTTNKGYLFSESLKFNSISMIFNE